ncbi:zinc ribbon domain-containing protein [Methanobacterium formicicum]|uniref:Putative zinc-ribbon domain-containing protein n=1 Tax=Methanobacterium formicicum TaxID=2162 RepID=A0A090JTJ6_METFO|nr:zinc ribbon domain-containing protein [Methanobacterium formicicum]MDH2659724.1 zinc ribbon domain-containing protein [Methanobacterium formicicum]CEA12756.1 hypothetical protein DSM1535_0393 [Methanobacterium formicicum]
MLGLRKSKAKKLEEKRIKDGNRFNDFFKTESQLWKDIEFAPGVGCTIELTETEIKSHGMLTKGAATAAFGLVGLAMTSGSKSKNVSIPATMRIVQNGILFQRHDDEDLRVPWENIAEVKVTPGMGVWKYLILDLFENPRLKVRFDRTVSKNVLNMVKKYIDSHIPGLDDGWNDAPIPLNAPSKHVESKPSEMDPNSCSNCGSPIEAGANFCSECGQRQKI